MTKLEKSSWVAGVISAILALITLGWSIWSYILPPESPVSNPSSIVQKGDGNVLIQGNNNTSGNETQVKNCGVAAGNNVNGNIITCNYGLSPIQLKELTHAAVTGATEPLLNKIETLSKKLGVTEEAAKIILKAVGEQTDLPDEDIAIALTKAATEYKNLKARVAAIDTSDPVPRALAIEVESEITAGHLQKAGYLLQKITKYTATLNGVCTKVKAMGVAVDSKLCLPQILNTEYLDGHNSFTFVIQKEEKISVISFSGYGPEQMHITDDEVLQPINKVIFTSNGSSDYLKANGTCRFTNPYKETAATISCEVNTSEGNFSGHFTSNGISPDVFEAGAGVSVQHSTPEVDQMGFLKGSCEPSSHIAEGKIDEDITKKQSRFFCDSAVIVPFSDDPNHRMIQFVDSKSNYSRIIGFSGLMKDENIMVVNNAYLDIGTPIPVSDGACKFFYKEEEVSQVVCGAKIDDGERRTVPVVAFSTENAEKTDVNK